MTAFDGLPDFQAMSSTATATATATTFAPFQSGSYAALPQGLALAADANGRPKFTLDLVERVGDFSATGQYAVLDFSLVGDFALDDALSAARAHDAGATVKPIAIDAGFARLYPTTGEVAPSSDLLASIPLGLSGTDYARWTSRLSADAGELVKGAIAGGSLLLGARVEFDAVGVAPRVAATVEFQAPQLLTSLLAGRSGRSMSTADVVATFTGSPQNFPLKIVGGGEPSGDFAGAVAGRIFAEFGTLVPAPEVADPPYVVFRDPAQLEGATVQWDLSQPAAGRRQWVLMLDILTALRAFAAANGLDSLVRNVTVPTLQVGFCSVVVNANLPPNRIGVPAIGANVQVAANPPLRPSSVSQTIAFEEPDDSGAFQFRLSPSEPVAYTLSGFAVIAAGETVQEYQMPPQPRTDSWVQLAADDFPVTFAHVTAAGRLLTLATLSLLLTYDVDGHSRQVQAVLNATVPGVSMAVPRSASSASLVVTATPLDGSAALTLPSMMPGRIDLDVTAFREYGPHRVTIHGTFKAGDRALFLDVLSDEQANAGAVPDQLFLTIAQPIATWGFVASSPFHSGYRYRKSGSPGVPAAAWSPVLSPFESLTLNADGTTIAASSNGPPAPPAQISLRT
jgi:hypothetical protein